MVYLILQRVSELSSSYLPTLFRLTHFLSPTLRHRTIANKPFEMYGATSSVSLAVTCWMYGSTSSAYLGESAVFDETRRFVVDLFVTKPENRE